MTTTPSLPAVIDALLMADSRIRDADDVLAEARTAERLMAEALRRAGYNVPQRNKVHAVIGPVVAALRAKRDALWAERDVIAAQMQTMVDMEAPRFPVTGREQAGLDPMTGRAETFDQRMAREMLLPGQNLD